ncbi:TPA: thiamine pyrophosphate-requiring protein [Candidatus Poribacteria bacterium]|nr:thiamine pyrophosphate-requiring protein [Candidatus Poribacteria bacterium]
MKGINAIANILKLEGVEYLFCFPANVLIDAAATVGIRPILARTERTALSIADGYTRVSNGNRIGVCAVQQGPGIENVFPGVAQAFADAVPILLLPGGEARHRLGVSPHFEAVMNYQKVTKWVAQINLADRIPEMMRRAFTLLRCGKNGPVVLETPTDVASEEVDDANFSYTPVKGRKTVGNAPDVKEAVKAVLAAENPLIHVGQGVMYACATNELIEFAELVQAPVMTTMAGKSAFPENHPLSIGMGGHTGTDMVGHFLQKADLVFGIGCSFSKSIFSTPIPNGKVMVQVTVDEYDINKEYPIDHAIIGDAKLVLEQLIDEVKRQAGPEGRRGNEEVAKEVKSLKDAWLSRWMPKLTSDEVPINPYRVIWDLMHTVDRTQTVVTHDSGNPRDQMCPFYEAIIPRGYIGWGKSTQLGYSLGLAMGAKLAEPEKLVVNVMGDAAFGMSGMDFETAVRSKIPILTIILNNSALGGYEKHMPVATERYGTKYLSGDYAKVAEGLGGVSFKVEKPEDIIPTIKKGKESVNSGQPTLIEVITREDTDFSRAW